jgi:putative addiction module component (TIGR02574 family)
MTTKTDELISMVESLPLDIKTTLVEKILNSLHPSQKEIDALWAKEAEKRVKEIKTGRVKTIRGEDVFREIKKRFYR